MAKQFQAHKLIVATARSMAHELYDCVMQDDELYASWKAQCEDLTPKISEKLFVELMYPKLIEAARANKFFHVGPFDPKVDGTLGVFHGAQAEDYPFPAPPTVTA